MAIARLPGLFHDLYAIVVLECRDNITHIPHFVAINLYDDGQGWPSVQGLLHYSSWGRI
jgi:hypothetical protein